MLKLISKCFRKMTASKYNTLLTGSPHHNVPLWKRNRYWKKGRKRKMKHKFRKDSKHECRMPNMKCFTHDNYHWKTPPYWTCKLFCLIIIFFLWFFSIPHCFAIIKNNPIYFNFFHRMNFCSTIYHKNLYKIVST